MLTGPEGNEDGITLPFMSVTTTSVIQTGGTVSAAPALIVKFAIANTPSLRIRRFKPTTMQMVRPALLLQVTVFPAALAPVPVTTLTFAMAEVGKVIVH
jgi:hypothetical protein